MTPTKHWAQYEVDFLLGNPRLTDAQIALAIGRTRRGVECKRQKLVKTPHRPSGALPGEKHPRALLTEEIVRQMRQRYTEGKAAGDMSILKLSNEFDVAVSTTWGVIARRTWKHI